MAGGSQKNVGRKWGEEKVVKGIGERKGTKEKRKRKKGKGNWIKEMKERLNERERKKKKEFFKNLFF